MAEAEIMRHTETAMSRWPLTGSPSFIASAASARRKHRVGAMLAHRQAALQAAEFLMDYLKANAPFWKREEKPGGTSWVDAHSHDDDAAARWTRS
jgi:molybdopterin synthase catalytic subunit